MTFMRCVTHLRKSILEPFQHRDRARLIRTDIPTFVLGFRVCYVRCSSSVSIPNSKGDFCLQENWKEKLETYPVTSFQGRIYCVRNLEDEQRPFIRKTLQEFSRQRALGFDTEFVCRPKQIKVCLVQMASDKKAVIWHVNRMEKESLAKSELARILQGKVLKVGHASSLDAKHLSKWVGMEVNNVVDTLSWAYKFRCKPKSLQAMCFMFLNCRISKSQQQSNWNSPFLSEKQIFYAACDPWVSLKLYQEMKRIATELNIELPRAIESVKCPVPEES